MKIVFMGTPEFAVPTLKALIQNHNVVAVVSQPDKPKGRGKKLSFPPVKEVAISNNIEVLQPKSLKDESFISKLRQYDADVFIVVAYGKILPESVLNMTKYGSINVHGSLLPKYRGAAPIQWAVIDGETLTGVTIMYMDKGLDTGDIILKKEMTIEPNDTAGSIHDKMSVIGAEALIEALQQIEQGTSVRIKQDDSMSSYAKMLTKEMGNIDFNNSVESIVNLVRGLNPWPTAYTTYKDTVLKIWNARKYDNSVVGSIGEIVSIIPSEGIIVQASNGTIMITEIQASNSKRMKISDYLRGNKIEEHSSLT